MGGLSDGSSAMRNPPRKPRPRLPDRNQGMVHEKDEENVPSAPAHGTRAVAAMRKKAGHRAKGKEVSRGRAIARPVPNAVHAMERVARGPNVAHARSARLVRAAAIVQALQQLALSHQ